MPPKKENPKKKSNKRNAPRKTQSKKEIILRAPVNKPKLRKERNKLSKKIQDPNLNTIGQMASFMCMPRKPVKIPRLVPVPCAAVHSMGEFKETFSADQLTNGLQVAYRVIPSLDFPVQKLTKVTDEQSLTADPETNVTHLFTADDRPIWLDNTLAVEGGGVTGFIKAANFQAPGRHFSESSGTTGAMKEGAKCYHFKPTWNTLPLNIYNTDNATAQLQVYLVGLGSDFQTIETSWLSEQCACAGDTNTFIQVGNKQGTDNTGSPVAGNVWMNSFNSNPNIGGFAIGLVYANASTIGRVPPGSKYKYDKSAFTIGASYQWVNQRVFNDESLSATRELMRKADCYSHTSMDIWFKEQETILSGTYDHVQVNWEQEDQIPGTPSGIVNYIQTTNNPNKIVGAPFHKGAHGYWKPYKLEDLQWKVERPTTPYDYEVLKTSAMYYVITLTSAVQTGVVYDVRYDINTELQTVDQILDTKPGPGNHFGLIELLLAMRMDENSQSCNGTHLDKVKNFVRKVVNNPEVRDIAKRLTRAGVQLALTAL